MNPKQNGVASMTSSCRFPTHGGQTDSSCSYHPGRAFCIYVWGQSWGPREVSLSLARLPCQKHWTPHCLRMWNMFSMPCIAHLLRVSWWYVDSAAAPWHTRSSVVSLEMALAIPPTGKGWEGQESICMVGIKGRQAHDRTEQTNWFGPTSLGQISNV